MQKDLSRVTVKGLKEANYNTLDCHGMTYPDFNESLLNDLTKDHTKRELSGMERELDIEVRRFSTVKEAAIVYRTLLKGMLSEKGMDISLYEAKGNRYGLIIKDCDFFDACPRTPHCMCLRGQYIKDALVELGPAVSGHADFISYGNKNCRISVSLELEDGTKKGSSLSVETRSYISGLENSLKKAPESKIRHFQMEHFSRGTLSSAKEVLPQDQFKAFTKMFKLQVREMRSVTEGRRSLSFEKGVPGKPSTDITGSAGGNIVTCPRCGSFINRSKNRTCFNCGYLVR